MYATRAKLTMSSELNSSRSSASAQTFLAPQLLWQRHRCERIQGTPTKVSSWMPFIASKLPTPSEKNKSRKKLQKLHEWNLSSKPSYPGMNSAWVCSDQPPEETTIDCSRIFECTSSLSKPATNPHDSLPLINRDSDTIERIVTKPMFISVAGTVCPV